MNIGVLALQGDFREHIFILEKLSIQTREVRLPRDLENLQGLIIPGGESTTIGKLLVKYDLIDTIKSKYRKGMAVYGTCAGAILLAKDILKSEQPRLGLIDIEISRNSYGRQIDSFETDIEISSFKKPFHAIFIRAPQILKTGTGVKILSRHNNIPVMLEKDKILITTFHPELTEDSRVHEYFVNMIK